MPATGRHSEIQAREFLFKKDRADASYQVYGSMMVYAESPIGLQIAATPLGLTKQQRQASFTN